MRIAVAATPSVAIPTLEWLRESENELALVITRPDRQSGRGRAMTESVVSRWATSHSVNCVKPVASLDLIDSLNDIDLVVTIGYGVILPSEVLSVPRFGFINLHFSHLPAWRGAAPVQRAILNGDPVLGVSVFALDQGMDTGPIYVQEDVLPQPYESAGEMLERMSLIGPDVIAKTLAMIETGSVPTPQSHDGVSYAPKISKEEARISWTQDSTHIDRHIRAFTPEPGAWTTWRNEPLRIDRARPTLVEGDFAPATVINQSGHVVVACGDGTSLVLEEVTPAGKKPMSAKSWANGARITQGESFV